MVHQWKQVGNARRVGVAAPLFSLYSKNSIGIGELPDLKLLIDWAKAAGMSLIQLFPMNDVGYNFRPYDAESALALEPLYLSLEELIDVGPKSFAKELGALRKSFPAGGRNGRVDFGVKRAKMELLLGLFERHGAPKNKAFERFVRDNQAWLGPYCCFKVAKELMSNSAWEDWPEPFKTYSLETIGKLEREHGQKILFHQWLQWQLFEQFAKVKAYARRKGVLLMGDLPFLVSRDSADVWAQPHHFKLGLAAGAPPDLYFSLGQRWGMPPYDWERIASDGYRTLTGKLKYAENFYDLFRIDHFVGIFRLWTIALSEPAANGGRNGVFDPREESRWEEHGRSLLSVMIQSTSMMPCAEDLGVVPECSYRVLRDFAIPGMEIQRWAKDWGHSYDFKAPENFRANSLAALSTHDMSPLTAWWEHEAGSIDEELFKRKCASRGVVFDAVREKLFDTARSKFGRLRWKQGVSNVQQLLEILGLREENAADFIDLYLGSGDERYRYWKYLGLSGLPGEKADGVFVRAAISKVNRAASLFSVQLLQDWMAVSDTFKERGWDFRINVPGTANDKNWSIVMPWPLEKFSKLPATRLIHKINSGSGRS